MFHNIKDELTDALSLTKEYHIGQSFDNFNGYSLRYGKYINGSVF